MADLKISQLPAATVPLAGTEVLPIVQSGSTDQVAVSDLTAGRAVAVGSLAATTTISMGGSNAAASFNNVTNIAGATTAYANLSAATVQAAVTVLGVGYGTTLSTVASAFTLTDLRHFSATQGTIGAASAITNQYGFYVSSTLTGATNNYGFYSNLAVSGLTRWTLWANGTAPSFFGGRIGLGYGGDTQASLELALPITGNVQSYGIRADGTVQSDVTGTALYFRTEAATQATAFNIIAIAHYDASQATFGAGSTVTNQYGFIVESSLTGATNNYGFRSVIAAATGRWNYYADGTANNAYAGNSRFGGVSAPAVAVDVTGAIAATTTVRTGSFIVSTLPSASAAGAGARALVTDAVVATYGVAPTGSGSVITSVCSNGTTWFMG